MTKNITAVGQETKDFAVRKYTVGLDLGDRWSWYCVLEERGEVVFEHKLSTTSKALREVFGAMPQSRPGAGADGVGQCCAGLDEVVWRTVTGLQPAEYGRGEEEGIECGAAAGIGAAVASDRVTQPTDSGL